MGADLSQMSLMALFRAEAAMHAQTLCVGLVSLPDHPDAAWFEAMMRAGHSLKGAARIVGLKPLVDLAHAIEDGFVGSMKAQQLPDAATVDAMLAAADLFGDLANRTDDELPTWVEARTDLIASLARAVREPGGAGAPAPTSGPERSALAPTAPPPPPPAAHEGATPPAAESPSPAPVHTAGAQAAAALGDDGAAPAAPDGGQRQVRLGTDTLDRMLAQAREALLVDEARDAEAALLRQLGRQWRRALSETGQLMDQLARPGDDARSRRDALDRLSALRDGLEGAQRVLDDFGARHERHSRRGRLAARSLYHAVRHTRMTTLETPSWAWRRMVRDHGRRLGKSVRFDASGLSTMVDRDVLERVESPLNHLLGNAVDHGLETAEQRQAQGKPATGTVHLSARHHKGRLLIEVADDGRGVDLERLRGRIVERGLAAPDVAARLAADELFEFLFLPGFTTRDQVSEVSGRGVGLDVVRSQVQALGGSVTLRSEPGRGSRFELSLPVSLSVLRALLVRVAGEVYAFALAQIERVERVEPGELHSVGGRPCARIGQTTVPVLALADQLGLAAPATDEAWTLVVLGAGDQARALRVDGLIGERNIGLLPLDPRLGRLRYVSAAAILDDGTPVLVLDSHRLGLDLADDRRLAPAVSAEAPAAARKRVLVVEDSFTVRELERQILTGAGYTVDARVDGEDGWQALNSAAYDLVITDIDMPRLTGIGLLRRLRALPRLRELPVMIVSYKDSEADRQAGLDAGADRYFVKSDFDDRALLAAVEDLVGAA